MAGTIKDVLIAQSKPEMEADYNYILDIPATVRMPSEGDKTQLQHKFDDGGIKIASLSDDSYFEVEVSHDALTEEEASELLHLWHDTDKANGMERTFYWENTKDTNIYVVRFMSKVTRVDEHRLGDYVTFEPYILRIEGWTTYYGS